MDKEPAIERRLSPVEESMWWIDKIRPFNGVLHATIEGTLTEETLRLALHSIQRRHPLLRVRIAGDRDTGPRFESGGVPEIPLRVVEVPEENWINEAESELHTMFSTEKGPLIRVVLLRHGGDKSTLLLTHHHIITDGICVAYLFRDLIEVAGPAQQGDEVSMPALAPKQAMLAYLPPWAKGIRGAIRSIFYLLCLIGSILRWGIPVSPKLDRWVPLCERKARIVSRELDPSFVKKLLVRTRRENTTMYGALAAAYLMAFALDFEKDRPRTFMLGSAIDMRKRLTPPIGEDIGFFATGCVSIVKVSTKSDFWELARKIRTSLLRSIRRGEPFVGLMLFILMDAFNRSLRAFGAGGSNFDQATIGSRIIGLSNIGELDIRSDHGVFTVKKLCTAPSGSVVGTFLSVTATVGGRLGWDFVGMEPLYAKEHTERVADTAIEILKKNLAH